MPRTTFSEAVKRANPLGDLQPPLPSPASSSPTGAGGLPQIHSTLPQLSTNPAPNALGSLGHFGQSGGLNLGTPSPVQNVQQQLTNLNQAPAGSAPTPATPRPTLPNGQARTPVTNAPPQLPVLGGGRPLQPHTQPDRVGSAIVGAVKPLITPVQLRPGSTSRPDQTMDYRPEAQRPTVSTQPLQASPLEMGVTAAGFTPPGLAGRVLSATGQTAGRVLGFSATRPLPAAARAVTAEMVEQNVPAAVLRNRPVYANVRRTTDGRWDADGFGFQPTQTYWTGVGQNLPVTETIPPSQVGSFQASARQAFGGRNPSAGYSHGTTNGTPGGTAHIAVRPGRDVEATLRHEGYHGMVDMLRGGTPRSAVEGARWYHAVPARLADSRSSFVKALGSHADEIGARMFGEGGLRGLGRGLRHIVAPHPIYDDILRYYNPTFARLAAGSRHATRAAPVVAGGAAGTDALFRGIHSVDPQTAPDGILEAGRELGQHARQVFGRR